MFGWGELTLIAILAIVLLGPDKLADLARTAGRIYGEYQKAKRRLELELIYGEEIPNEEKLREIQRKKIEELTLDLKESLNTLRSNEEGWSDDSNEGTATDRAERAPADTSAGLHTVRSEQIAGTREEHGKG